MREAVSENRGAINLLNDIYDNAGGLDVNECVHLIEEYLKRVTFQKAYKEAGDAYNKEGYEQASKVLNNYVEWERSFSLTDAEFTDVVSTFKERFYRIRHRPVHKRMQDLLPVSTLTSLMFAMKDRTCGHSLPVFLQLQV